ncbi:MAG: hypothetical protein ABEL51_09640 [Salinibacter sp.]
MIGKAAFGDAFGTVGRAEGSPAGRTNFYGFRARVLTTTCHISALMGQVNTSEGKGQIRGL